MHWKVDIHSGGQTRICSNTHRGHSANKLWVRAWNSWFLGQQYPNDFSRACSNPDGDVQPWCYVAETEEGIYWRYCDIPTCHSELAGLDNGGGRDGVHFCRPHTEPDPATPSVPGYLGCFVDSGAPPALSGPSGTSTKLTVQVCLRFCRMKGYQVLPTCPD